MQYFFESVELVSYTFPHVNRLYLAMSCYIYLYIISYRNLDNLPFDVSRHGRRLMMSLEPGSPLVQWGTMKSTNEN